MGTPTYKAMGLGALKLCQPQSHPSAPAALELHLETFRQGSRADGHQMFWFKGEGSIL